MADSPSLGHTELRSGTSWNQPLPTTCTTNSEHASVPSYKRRRVEHSSSFEGRPHPASMRPQISVSSQATQRVDHSEGDTILPSASVHPCNEPATLQRIQASVLAHPFTGLQTCSAPGHRPFHDLGIDKNLDVMRQADMSTKNHPTHAEPSIYQVPQEEDVMLPSSESAVASSWDPEPMDSHWVDSLLAIDDCKDATPGVDLPPITSLGDDAVEKLYPLDAPDYGRPEDNDDPPDACPNLNAESHDHDTFSLGDSEEKAMIDLVEPKGHPSGSFWPPSSVVREMDTSSQAVACFDSSLQRSSPRQTPPLGGMSATQPQEDLLDEEVDWNEVFDAVSANQLGGRANFSIAAPPDAVKISSPDEDRKGSTSQHAERPTKLAGVNHRLTDSPADHTGGAQASRPNLPGSDGTLGQTPFVRRSFPARIRDKPCVPGLSRSIISRTCFRIGELLNENSRCYREQQDVVYDFFARVTYSHRDHHAKIQHFQFTDLFRDQLPYLTGKLQDWKNGSLLDQQSQVFLADWAKLMMCRCMAKMMRDAKVQTGWVVCVLSIRETDWSEVGLTKRIFG